jgi:hypothetical protein
MSVYRDRFHMILEFQDYQQRKRDGAKSPWHRKASRGGEAMNQHQVAKRYQGRHTGGGEFMYAGELNHKIEALRNGTSKMKMLSDVDIKHIMKNYKIKELPKDKPKTLFSGVDIVWDPIKDCYILKRYE